MMRRLGVATAVSVALLVGGCGGSGHTTALPGLTGARLAKLEVLAREEASAAISLGGHASSAMVYATTYRQALAASGMKGLPARVGSQPVYVVVLRGRFDCAGCSTVFPQEPLRGGFDTLVLDRGTLSSRYGGSIVEHVDTSRFGPGVPISVKP